MGDRILGYFSHMGAGSIMSNVKSDKRNVIVRDGTEKFETGIKKFGAMLGDYVEVGCNAVCNPGTASAGTATFTPPPVCAALYLRIRSGRITAR